MTLPRCREPGPETIGPKSKMAPGVLQPRHLRRERQRARARESGPPRRAPTLRTPAAADPRLTTPTLPTVRGPGRTAHKGAPGRRGVPRIPRRRTEEDGARAPPNPGIKVQVRRWAGGPIPPHKRRWSPPGPQKSPSPSGLWIQPHTPPAREGMIPKPQPQWRESGAPRACHWSSWTQPHQGDRAPTRLFPTTLQGVSSNRREAPRGASPHLPLRALDTTRGPQLAPPKCRTMNLRRKRLPSQALIPGERCPRPTSLPILPASHQVRGTRGAFGEPHPVQQIGTYLLRFLNPQNRRGDSRCLRGRLRIT